MLPVEALDLLSASDNVAREFNAVVFVFHDGFKIWADGDGDFEVDPNEQCSNDESDYNGLFHLNVEVDQSDDQLQDDAPSFVKADEGVEHLAGVDRQ